MQIYIKINVRIWQTEANRGVKVVIKYTPVKQHYIINNVKTTETGVRLDGF